MIPAHVDPALVRAFDYHIDAEFLNDPFARFDRARGDRAFYSESQGGYWVLTRAEDIHAAFQQPHIFSSEQFAIPQGVYPRTLRPLALDPPDHGRYRQPLASFFAPQVVARREPVLRDLCATLIDDFAPDGSADLLDRLARPYPTTVFMEIFGLPLAELPTFQGWSHDFLHAYDRPEIRAAAAKNILQYLEDFVSRRSMEGPADRDDLFALLQNTSIEGRPLGQDELLDYAFMLFVAGLDTVTGVLGFTLWCLARRPDLQARLRADPTLTASTVEEMLRAHSIINTARVVAIDTEFAGVAMKAGDRVLLATSLASRDPAACDRADEIVVDREVNRHLAFGAGPHRCVGSHLARLELRLAIEELLGRLPEFRLASGEPITIHGGGSIGIDRLVVQWDSSQVGYP